MLGWGSIYNHDLNPNADIDYPDIKEEKYLQFKAVRDIEVGEEIVFNYEFDNDIADFLILD
jgi:SET domain-containing protein